MMATLLILVLLSFTHRLILLWLACGTWYCKADFKGPFHALLHSYHGRMVALNMPAYLVRTKMPDVLPQSSDAIVLCIRDSQPKRPVGSTIVAPGPRDVAEPCVACARVLPQISPQIPRDLEN